ncbi:adenylate/guanylate cyclase domain-containing protein [Rhizobium sp. BK251]|uniref:adenylate/guanylate cyclase domain-containing protein n=1 Tax=Rhizobium sp. BK251 TaxID=2512125 RepID=UPI00104556D7|nr:adenylate/guanylate cyclase domain-containing protein [Rhizobium sp. BK251]TCL68336.1 adenylate cyclase [Rhizobium sp. BK251]
MTTQVQTPLLSEQFVRNARLGSGLLIFLFVVLHLTNHSLGLISLSAAEEGRQWFVILWRNPLGTLVFYGAVVVHVLLVLRSLYLRRSLVMPISEALQIIVGLSIPVILIDHVVGTRIVHELYRYSDTYHTIIRLLWISSPLNGARQALAVVAAWFHGCIGVHYWLRYRPWYGRAAPWLLTLAILLPVLALLGFAQMGRTLEAEIEEGGNPSGYYGESQNYGGSRSYYGSREADAEIARIRVILYGSFAFAVLSVVALRTRRKLKERANLIAVRYPGGEIVRVPRGFTVLEASRLGGLPHYSVCGGKGQCSTCRVQVIEGAASLPAPGPIERHTLHRIAAGPDVRLACQLRPVADLSVAPLLVPAPEGDIPANSVTANPGREHEIVVLFCDLRSFTMLTETRLPFDIVFLLNRYFAVVGQAVEQAGGRVDKFIGDGAMALFGLNGTAADGCRQALAAAARIIEEIDRLDKELSEELTLPLRIAIGIHTGPAVVGTLGYGRARNLTAIGDTVNVASRLESVAKEYDAELVISEPVAALSGVDVSGIDSHDIAIRGRSGPLKIYVVPKEKSGVFA